MWPNAAKGGRRSSVVHACQIIQEKEKERGFKVMLPSGEFLLFFNEMVNSNRDGCLPMRQKEECGVALASASFKKPAAAAGIN